MIISSYYPASKVYWSGCGPDPNLRAKSQIRDESNVDKISLLAGYIVFDKYIYTPLSFDSK